MGNGSCRSLYKLVNRTKISHRNSTREVIFAQLALFALAIVCVLAFIPSNAALADKTALLAVGIAGAVFCWTPLIRHLKYSSQCAAFALTAMMFLVYGMARGAGPMEGFALQFAALPGDKFVVPYSAYIVVLAALVTGPYWWFHCLNWTRSLLAGIGIVALLSFFSFFLLQRHYPSGTTEILDPTPLPTLSMLLIEYTCVALLCHAVAIQHRTRSIALRVLPAVLLLIAARHHFFVVSEEGE